MKENFLAEGAAIKEVVSPADLNTTGATGARVDMSKSARVAFIVHLADATAAAVDLTLRQHDAASGGNSKDLEVDNAYFHKVGAATSFTKVEPSSKAAALDLAAILAADPGIVVLEVLASQLDVNNGFSHASVDVGDPGEARVIGVVAVGHQPFKQSAHEVEL